MKNILLLLLILVLAMPVFAQQGINKAVKTYAFSPAKQINLTDTIEALYANIVDGNFNVFTYTFKHQEEEGIADDEMIEKITFQVNQNWKNFTFKNKINLSQPFYTQQCYCTGRGNHHITSGIIKGKKLPNGNFKIEATLVVTFNNNVTKNITFKGEFKRAD